MQDLLGFTSIAFVSLITLLLALRWPAVSRILFTALSIRIFIILLGHYLITLPDSDGDARSFEWHAWLQSLYVSYDDKFNLSEQELVAHKDISSLLNYYEGPSAQFISFILAIPYYFLGRSMLMAQSISLLLGIFTVFLGWKIATIIWNNQIAKKAGWFMALFPSLILYSSLTMKEAYISFFLVIALYGCVFWVKKNNLKSVFIALTGFTGAIFFHGSFIVGAIIFVLIVGFHNFKKIFISPTKIHFSYKIFIFLLLFVVLSGLYVSNKIKVPYLGSFEASTDINRLLHKTNINTRGDAAWPEWLKINSPIEVIYKVPVRTIYFVFSPFPWDIKKDSHLIGMLDAFLYFYLSFLIFRNRQVIWKDRVLRIITIILLSYLVVYSVGVGNFGTALRHRSKFVIMFILLAAPMIKRFIFLKKTNNT